MKGKLLIFLFGVAFMTLAQLLVYYGNPTNWTTLESALKNPMALTYNLIFAVAPILMLILLWRLIKVEDDNERTEQTNRVKTAVKEALNEYKNNIAKQDVGEINKKIKLYLQEIREKNKLDF